MARDDQSAKNDEDVAGAISADAKTGKTADRQTPSPEERAAKLAAIPREWLEEFEAAARRPLEQRMRYAFIRTYKPVLDDVKFRSFDTMAQYREWCEKNLPAWLGYGRI
jgi:hypothetical protein